jgi:phosphoserine phosphatase
MPESSTGQISLVVFDLDGTLLRGDGVLVALAPAIGRAERMLKMEQGHTLTGIRENAEEMAS